MVLFAGNSLHPIVFLSFNRYLAKPGIDRTIIIVDKIFITAEN